MTAPFSQPRVTSISIPPGWGASGQLVVVPARNEAERIGDCLSALRPQATDVLVVANNCSDATGDLAAKAGVAVIHCLIPDGGVGAARRIGVALGLRHIRDAAAILTTDADCIVAEDWVAANLREIREGAAAVCGLVKPIAEEHAALPSGLLRRAALEDHFLALKALLELQLTGNSGHEQTPGASLAFTPEAYAAAGGFDPMPTHEDRAIILRLKSLGLPVVHRRDITVYASCRLEGRAPGGMAAALRDRAADPTAPLCPDMSRSDHPAIQRLLDRLGPLRTQDDLPAAIIRVEELLRQAPARPSSAPRRFGRLRATDARTLGAGPATSSQGLRDVPRPTA